MEELENKTVAESIENKHCDMPSLNETEGRTVVEDMRQNVWSTSHSFANRIAASDAEYWTAEFLADRLECAADDVSVEQFGVRTLAYDGWKIISATFMILAYSTYYFSCFVSVLLTMCAIIPFVGHILFCGRMFDGLYPEKSSQNVFAIKRASGEKNKRIYLVAHIDNPSERIIEKIFGERAEKIFEYIFVAFMPIMFVLGIARWAVVGELGTELAYGTMLYLGVAATVFLPFVLAQFFSINGRRASSRKDNLMTCEIAIKAFEELKEAGREHCEIGVLLMGSGEIGAQGAKAWIKAHIDEIDKENSLFLCLDAVEANAFAKAGFKVKDLLASSGQKFSDALDDEELRKSLEFVVKAVDNCSNEIL